MTPPLVGKRFAGTLSNYGRALKSPIPRLFPYLVAVGGTERVTSYPELDGATVYGVKYGTGEALLFLGRDDGAARAFERTLVRYAARGGRSTPARRKGRVLLIWTVPMESPSASSRIDGCVD
jgi:hypothetical protein